MAARQARDEAPDCDTAASDPGRVEPIAPAPTGGGRGGDSLGTVRRRRSARLRAGRLVTLLLLTSAGLVVAPAVVNGAARPSTSAATSPITMVLETITGGCSGPAANLAAHRGEVSGCEKLDSFAYSLIGKGAPTGSGLAAGGGVAVTPNQVTATMAADANSTALFADLATGRLEKAWTVYFRKAGRAGSEYTYLSITFKNVFLTSWTLTASNFLLPAVQVSFQYQQASLQYFQQDPASGAVTPVSSGGYNVSKQAAG